MKPTSPKRGLLLRLMMTTTLLSPLLAACGLQAAGKDNNTPIGMSLRFYNHGQRSIVVQRFDPDGLRGPVPGALGPSLTEFKQMAFMPGDSKRPVPQFVQVEWIEHNEKYIEWSTAQNKLSVSEQQSPENRKQYQELWAANPHYKQRVDLTPILTPELLARVRADSQNTQLQLTILFKEEQVSITAEAYKWRYTNR